MIEDMKVQAQKAKKAAQLLANASTQKKNDFLELLAQCLEKEQIRIEQENQKDVKIAIENNLKPNLVDRLLLNKKRIQAMTAGLRQVATLADPVGEVISGWKRPNGLIITKVRVPLGVLAIIYEARPNVTIDSIGLGIKAGNALVLRGSSSTLNSNRLLTHLARESLRLQNIRLSNQSERLAWLAENLPKFKGSGIIYCLTVADTERVTGWLKQKGFSAEAYHAGDDGNMDRPALEQAFLNNEIKILVATVALGMGFDKPDINFVIHFQRPGSVVAYYQQVGRAGRAVEKSYGVLLSGAEDDEIQNYFIESAFPSTQVFLDILQELEKSEGLSLYEILARVNTSKSMAEKALKILEVDGAVGQTFDKKVLYFRTPNPWVPETDRINRVLDLRRSELAQMQAFVDHPGCLMKFLLEALDDPNPVPCGRCANCQGKGFSASVPHELVIEAENFLKGTQVLIQPRKQWPVGLFPDQKRNIPFELQNATGRSLCYYGDAGWGKIVQIGKYREGHFPDELVYAASHLILDLWKPEPFPAWVTSIPSTRHPNLVSDFSTRLAKSLGIPFHPVFRRTSEAPEQKTMQNSTMQARNVVGTISIDPQLPSGAVLLVDDIIDSGWTLTMAGYLLKVNGSGPVYPFTLAQAAGRNTNG